MPRRLSLLVVLLAVSPASVFADEVLYRYEGDVLPYDPSEGWIVAHACEDPCSESLADGHFILHWSDCCGLAHYHRNITDLGEEQPPTLWVEWRFRSNLPVGPVFTQCDANLSVIFREIVDHIYIYGDSAFSPSGNGSITGLDVDEFHTYRFESLDGTNYRYSVDGIVFLTRVEHEVTHKSYVQASGMNSCGDWTTNKIHEWDALRYGTVSLGEQIIATDPPAGEIDTASYPGLDRFSVTFDSANNVYTNEITVEVTGGPVPVVTQVLRLEEYDVDTVQVVLDRTLTTGETTTFTFDDGAAVNVVQYVYGAVEACCQADGSCTNLPAEDCTTAGGTPQGELTACEGDADGDGVDGNCGDACPNNVGKTDPGVCGCGSPDIDSDNDGTLDCLDACRNDPDKIEPGICGCGVSDYLDADDDTVPDCIDQCEGLDDRYDHDNNGVPDCTQYIPAVSTWGLVVLTLLLMTLSKLAFSTRRNS